MGGGGSGLPCGPIMGLVGPSEEPGSSGKTGHDTNEQRWLLLSWSENTCGDAEPQVQKGRRSRNAAARRRQINCHVLVLINYQKGRRTISLSQ